VGGTFTEKQGWVPALGKEAGGKKVGGGPAPEELTPPHAPTYEGKRENEQVESLLSRNQPWVKSRKHRSLCEKFERGVGEPHEKIGRPRKKGPHKGIRSRGNFHEGETP